MSDTYCTKRCQYSEQLTHPFLAGSQYYVKYSVRSVDFCIISAKFNGHTIAMPNILNSIGIVNLCVGLSKKYMGIGTVENIDAKLTK